MIRLLALALSGLALAGCVSAGTHGGCLDDTDPRQWRRLHAPPPNADAYRSLVDAAIDGYGFRPRRELWWRSQENDIIYCRLSENLPPLQAPTGYSFEFDARGELVGEVGSWVIVD